MPDGSKLFLLGTPLLDGFWRTRKDHRDPFEASLVWTSRAEGAASRAGEGAAGEARGAMRVSAVDHRFSFQGLNKKSNNLPLTS